MFHKKLKKPTEININTYKTFLTIFNRVKSNAKQKYFETILYENKNNIKETWSILRKILKNQENDRNMPSSFNINGNETLKISVSFVKGIVPLQMKIAKIIPIFKSGPKNSLNNYRPISLLPAFSKLLEKIVAQQLVKFLDKYNILYEHQYGFRKKHSTIYPILHLLNYIADSSDKPSKDITLGLFF